MLLSAKLAAITGLLLTTSTTATESERKAKHSHRGAAHNSAKGGAKVTWTQQKQAPVGKGEDDGQLPSVADMMGKSFEGFNTLSLKLASETDNFAAEVHRLQQDETDRMARMKAELEQALSDQVATEKELTEKNQKLETGIKGVRAEIQKLRQDEKELRARLTQAARSFEAEQGEMVIAAKKAQGLADKAAAAEHDSTDADSTPEASEMDEGDEAESLLVVGAAHSQSLRLGAVPSHIYTEEQEQSSTMLGQLRSLATGLGQMLRLERQTEGRYEAAFRARLAARKEHVERMRAESKKLTTKLNNLRRKRDKLKAAVVRLESIYSGLSETGVDNDEADA
jgi:predicted  nucleic acid-binding Zn-ribbon protein